MEPFAWLLPGLVHITAGASAVDRLLAARGLEPLAQFVHARLHGLVKLFLSRQAQQQLPTGMCSF